MNGSRSGRLYLLSYLLREGPASLYELVYITGIPKYMKIVVILNIIGTITRIAHNNHQMREIWQFYNVKATLVQSA